MQAMSRPTFSPTFYDTDASAFSPLGNAWIPIVSCPADIPQDLFEVAARQLVEHPEYNSTLILRSDILHETESYYSDSVPTFANLRKLRCLHRRLLPRRPGRDAPLEQYCTFYASSTADDAGPDTLVLTPITKDGIPLPYYHPAVHHLAFRYQASETPTLHLDVLPLSDTSTALNSRLSRTCLALLETLHRYGWGALTNYKKRVNHDILVPREAYQDLYLVMRERHKHLVDTWQEVTDPLKHVFEDIGIATFLILLWKGTSYGDSIREEYSLDEPWKQWPRPPGGFIDFGCGNGLLTHILTEEGYIGVGIDVRARTSWQHYPPSTQAALQVQAFDPTAPRDPIFVPGAFIIANHADELTPWTPVIATLYESSGYLSIPCCAWAFDAKFERSSTSSFPIPEAMSANEFADSLNLGGDGSHKSSYSTYRIWLASLALHCGWEVECETLRIPSTRNWAIVGRRRQQSLSTETAVENVEEIVTGVKNRGLFMTRKPEGKAGDH